MTHRGAREVNHFPANFLSESCAQLRAILLPYGDRALHAHTHAQLLIQPGTISNTPKASQQKSTFFRSNTKNVTKLAKDQKSDEAFLQIPHTKIFNPAREGSNAAWHIPLIFEHF